MLIAIESNSKKTDFKAWTRNTNDAMLIYFSVRCVHSFFEKMFLLFSELVVYFRGRILSKKS